MPFDLSPVSRAIPDCGTCPVRNCPGCMSEVAGAWRGMADLLVPQLPGLSRLMNVGDPLEFLYVVRAGCIKSYTIDANGNEHVRAFHFAGDLVGLEAFGSARAVASAEPVTPSQVCAVSTVDLAKRLAIDPALASLLLARGQHDWRQALALLGESSADQRVAAFLLDVRSRIGGGDVLRLPMTRREIGSYLRLATETVCRVLTRFEQKGLLLSRDKRITLRDVDALCDLAEPAGLAPRGMQLAA